MVAKGKDGGKDSECIWDGHEHTAIFKMDNQQGPTVQHRELCSTLCGNLDGRGCRVRMDTYMCRAESLLLKLLQHCQLAIYPNTK